MNDMIRNAVVVVLDRVSTAYLSAYGNTWLDMPAWNRLAAEAFLFDGALAHSTRLDAIHHAYWHGQSTTHPGVIGERLPSLAERLAERGLASRLVTDDARVAAFAESARFATIEMLTPGDDTERRACDAVEETSLGRFFAAAVEQLGRIDSEPGLLWFHARALDGPWDAPYLWRKRLTDDEDPDPPTFVAPPHMRLDPQTDPDVLFGLTRAYGAQLLALDACLGAFLDAFDELPASRSTLLVVTSPRGYPLGEHGRVGSDCPALYGEQLHVPLLIRSPDRLGAMARSDALVQPADLFPTLCAWWDVPPVPRIGPQTEPSLGGLDLWPVMRDDQRLARSHVLAIGDHESAVRTGAWHLRRPDAGPAELYVKPDDRFEVNEIASRCPAALAELRAWLGDTE
ncbi:MAG: hypothetical protein FJ297_00230 [Planctomycetes bacterium]|nr:hypothetical protein [Planctomycetota bacterium]